MAGKFELPELGEGVEQGDIVSIAVSEGDVVEPGQSVIELETDKATVDVPFEEGGKITEILVEVGDTVKIGAPLFSYESASGGDESEEAESPEEEMDEEPEAEEPERVEGESEEEGSPGRPAKEKEKDAGPEAGETEKGIIPAGPAVRRIAREKGIDLAEVKGTGNRGRITVEDVESFAEDASEEEGPSVQAQTVKMPDFTKFGEVEKESFSNVRRATAKHMSLSWSTAPHVTQHILVDVTALEAWRQRNLRVVEKAGGKLTVTAIIVKVVAEAMERFPYFNASIDMAREEIILKKYVNIGIAVDTPRGLLVPVMKDVDRKSITEIAIEIGEISDRARNGKTGLDELAGGCFTVTNIGGIGGHFFTPIINHPEVAILGVSRSRTEPVYRDGKFVPAEILPLSLSYDHRLIDGADAARFVKWIADVLENPMSMLL